jgi:hypothetical protein
VTPKLTEFWMEWRFDSAMPEWSLENGELQIMEQMKANGDMRQPIYKDGELHGYVEPVEVQLREEGRVMRVRFDTDDVALPVYGEERDPDDPRGDVD